MTLTLAGLLADLPDGNLAIGGNDRPWLTHGKLRALVQQTRSSLHQTGLGPTHRIAVVLPNGPEMAAAFVSIAQTSVIAPLNPAFKRDEFDFYLSDLCADAIVLPEGYKGAALDAAHARGLRILWLGFNECDAAGQFSLDPDVATPAAGGLRAPDDTDCALILHTSGTTSRPKMVPLLHRNLASSIQAIRRTLELTQADRCLNIMPLFHIHGLMAAVSASLASGGSVWCAPGFDALRFFSWMSACQPSWYTAVPTMHQAILSRAARHIASQADVKLRFVRSSSAALPAQVWTELSRAFGVPVIESYGMTEAAHQMTSSPIQPGSQKPGSVGIAAGPLVRIADEAVNELIAGTGEVVISGPNVTPGYLANPEANACSFFEAEGRQWFRTGDQGKFDADGYLVLSGRLKEQINRGGQKISPSEIDTVLLDHPAVRQAVTFAMPHRTLGEEVAVAVILHDSMTATEHELRSFAQGRLAAFKTPRRVVILTEIPMGPTGKLQRIGLAAKLGLTVTA